MCEVNYDPNAPENSNESNSTGISIDTAFAMLSDERRRLILRYLAERPDDVAHQEDVAEYLVDHYPDVDESERDSIAIVCYHQLLPKLAETEMVDYDSRSGTIRYYANERMENVLDVASELEE